MLVSTSENCSHLRLLTPLCIQNRCAQGKAFHCEYFGSASLVFLKILTAHYSASYKSFLHYGKVIAVVQSSGTEKVRMAVEVSKLFGFACRVRSRHRS